MYDRGSSKCFPSGNCNVNAQVNKCRFIMLTMRDVASFLQPKHDSESFDSSDLNLVYIESCLPIHRECHWNESGGWHSPTAPAGCDCKLTWQYYLYQKRWLTKWELPFHFLIRIDRIKENHFSLMYPQNNHKQSSNTPFHELHGKLPVLSCMH